MRKALVGLSLVALLVAVGGISYWAGSRAGAATAPKAAAGPGAPGKGGPPPGVLVEAARVATVKLPNALGAVGSLRSDESVVVRPEIAGRVSRILFREGERVAKGAPLFKLDDSIQQADLDKARANLTLTKSKFERAVDLRNKGFISGQARDEAENQFKVAQAEAELMEARLAKTTIHAPFAGTIGLRQVSAGDYVKEGQDLVNLESLDPLKVDFRVPETALGLVKDNQTLQLTLDALPEKVYEGRVYAINPLIDANGRAVVVRAQVANREGRLRPGMFARVRLFTTEMKDTLVVPEESLFPMGSDKFVYKVVDGKAARQKVEIGTRRDGRVEVLAGLGPQDLVVTAGHLKIRDGSAVKVANAAAPAAPVAGQPVGKAEPAAAIKAKGNS